MKKQRDSRAQTKDLSLQNGRKTELESQFYYSPDRAEAQNQLEGGLNQGGSNGEGERWSNSKYILKVELTGFVNGLECKVSEQEKMPRCFHLSKWKNGVDTD